MSTKVDVAIIGSGIAGAFIAYLLGKAGFKVLVLEKESTVGSKGAEFLKFGGVRLFEKYGLLPDLMINNALQRKVIRYYHDGKLIRHLDFSHYNDGYFLIVPYKKLVGTILSACRPYPQVDFWFNATVSTIDTNSKGIESLVLQDGRVVQAKVVVGADGIYSVIMPYLNGYIDTWTYDHEMYCALLPIVSSISKYNQLYFSSKKWFAYFYPLNHTTTRAFIGVPTIESKQESQKKISAKQLTSFVTESTDILEKIEEVEFQQIPIMSSLTSRYFRQNAILLGSGVFSFHPMTGLGMSYALKDAEILATVITDAFRNHSSLQELLTVHYESRRSIHKQVLDYGNRLARTFFNLDEYQKCFRPELHCGE